MNAPFDLAVLSVPAMLMAGVASSAHCALMCGLLQARQTRAGSLGRHGGRLAAYALLGAVAGGAGAWLLRAGAWLPWAEAMRLVALPVLLFVLFLPRRARSAACCAAVPLPASGPGVARQALIGAVGGLAPCALLYTAAAYAALSGSAGRGTLLMLAFGLGTVPAVQAGAWAWTRFGTQAAGTWPARRLRLVCALAVTLGFAVSTGASALWCAT